MPAEAYIAVGSNIEPEKYVPAAVARLREETEVLTISTFYRTRPVGRPEQPDYRNGMVRLRTELGRDELVREVLKRIEAKLGRERSADRYTARTIDLDVAVYCAPGGAVWAEPAVAQHNFIAAPLAELSPGLALPPAGRTAAQVADDLGRAGLEPDEALTRRLREVLKHEQDPR